MPKSKRNKIVNLTNTRKKNREHKEILIQQIRDAIDTFDQIFVFSVANMRNNFLKEMREEWKGRGRFFLGKTKLMARALGLSEEDEYAPALSSISNQWMTGPVGLFLSNEPADEILNYFNSFEREDYARGGFCVNETISIPPGPLHFFTFADAADQVAIPPSMEPQLRALSMPTALKKGTVQLLREYSLCKKGEALTHDQAKLLKLFGIKMSVFKVQILGWWNKSTGLVQSSSQN